MTKKRHVVYAAILVGLAAGVFACGAGDSGGAGDGGGTGGTGGSSSKQRPKGFDLEYCLIPSDEIRGGGPPKDGIPALVKPSSIPADEAQYLPDSDLVVGVVIGKEARAYPLRILVWHENANDSLGGKPIAVTYCPLCHSAIVFDRKVGGKVREFGVSGLLYNSNVLLYDRNGDPKRESLWSQLLMRAVCGPAAKEGLELTPLPSELVTWGDWRKRHGETTVLSLPRFGRDYSENPYRSYFATDRLMFPVSATPEELARFDNKEPMIAVRVGGTIKAYAVSDIARVVDGLRPPDPAGVMRDEVAGHKVRFTYVRRLRTVRAELVEGTEDAPAFAVAYTFWFAWKAMYPTAEVFTPRESDAE